MKQELYDLIIDKLKSNPDQKEIGFRSLEIKEWNQSGFMETFIETMWLLDFEVLLKGTDGVLLRKIAPSDRKPCK